MKQLGIMGISWRILHFLVRAHKLIVNTTIIIITNCIGGLRQNYSVVVQILFQIWLFFTQFSLRVTLAMFMLL